MTVAIISHPDCVLHDAGLGHPEQPGRIQVIQTSLQNFAFKKPIAFYEAPLATHDELTVVHDNRYVDWIISIAPKEGVIGIDQDTIMNPYTLPAALRAAGSVSFAVDLVMQNQAQVAFCNVRPPGHHAEREKAMGFCIFNNVAVGAMHALLHHRLNRVAIIDFDVHHGNGTQDIFQRNKQVMYCSSFQHPFYPGYDEEMDNEHIINVPLAAGTNGATYRAKVQAAWFEKLNQFKPELILFSAGFDAHMNDPLANIDLTKEDYVWLTTEIAKIAKIHCQGRIISVLEGGYDLTTLAECVPAHVNTLI